MSTETQDEKAKNLAEAEEERTFRQRSEERAKRLGFSSADEMAGELRRSGLIR